MEVWPPFLLYKVSAQVSIGPAGFVVHTSSRLDRDISAGPIRKQPKETVQRKGLELVHHTFRFLRDKVPWVTAATGESTGLTPPGLNCQRQQPMKHHPHESPHGGSKPSPASLGSQNCHG